MDCESNYGKSYRCVLWRGQNTARRATAQLKATLGVIGGKWKLLILWHLTRNDLRFSALRRALPRITQHMLTAQLRELEADGLITRTIYAEVPPRIVYAVTDHGRSLDQVLHVLYEWGAVHLSRRLPPDDISVPQAYGIAADRGPPAT